MLPQQKRIMKVVEKIFKGFWKSHRKTLGLLVNSLLTSERAGVCELGRYMPVETSPKHAIKRVNYFLGNEKVDVLNASEQLITWLTGPRGQIVISVDWTKYRHWPVLLASIMYQGRSLPVFWTVMNQPWLTKSVNTFENTFFQLLKMMISKEVETILLLDRGFRRVSLINHLESLGFKYVIRVCEQTHIQTANYKGPLSNALKIRGQCRDLGEVALSQRKPTNTRLVACFEEDQKEPWLLATNLHLPKRVIVRLYGKRFQIEENFRDQKCYRFGYGLGNVLMKKPDHLERLLLVIALAQMLTLFIGALACQQQLDRQYSVHSSAKKGKYYSYFTLGKYYILRIAWTLDELKQIILSTMESAYEKIWG